MNLYAITESQRKREILRIPLAQDVQEIVTQQFNELVPEFCDGKEIIPFDGNYNTTSDELFSIKDFDLEEQIINSLTNGFNFDILDINNLDGKIKSIYAVNNNNQSPEIYFQVFDTRKIIANKGIPLFNNNGTYTRFINKGIVILNRLTMVYRDSNIYFKSYFNARRIVNLSEYYREATNADVEDLMELDIFSLEDEEGFVSDLNSNTRKKIKSIQESGVLNDLNLDDFRNQANNFGIKFQYGENNIVIPRDKSYIRNLLKFLDEDYFVSALTSRRFVTNSKREFINN